MWYTLCAEGDQSNAQGAIARIASAGVAANYPLPDTTSACARAPLILGPDGNVWFTTSPNALGTVYQLGSIAVNANIAEYPLPSGDAPSSLVAGSDGNLWYYTLYYTGGMVTGAAIRGFSLTTHTVFATISTTVTDAIGLVTNPDDGTIVTIGASTVYHFIPGPAPSLTTVATLPSGVSCAGGATGGDGNLYFQCTQNQSSVLAVIAQRTYAIKVYPEQVSGTGISSNLNYFAPIVFQSGGLYINGSQAGAGIYNNIVGTLTPSGSLTAYFDLDNNFSDTFFDIAPGPNGSTWVVAQDHTGDPYLLQIGAVTESANRVRRR
jgi:hypothetical protein